METNSSDHYLAFDKNWFERHQRLLLLLLNNRITKKAARYILRIHKDCPDRLIVKILPNCYTVFNKWVDEETVELTTDFRTHWKFSKQLYYTFKPLWWAIHFWDWLIADRLIPQWSFGFSTLTQYPGSNGSLNPVDGDCGRGVGGVVDENFSTIVAGAGDNNNTGGSSAIITLIGSTTSNQFKTLRRGIFVFDTSSLTSGATISAATLSFACSLQTNGLGSTDLHVCASTPASDTALANADYSQLGSTSFGSLAYASWVVDSATYNSISLNASGISNISKTGNSRFGTRLAWDINGSFTGTWASSGQTRYFLNTFAGGGTTSGPKLVVTYSIAATLTNMWLPPNNQPVFEQIGITAY